MYDYRKMTPDQRREAVEYRRLRERPWHSPPHWEFAGLLQFMISSACCEHKHIIGVTPERMSECESALLDACGQFATNLYAWCVLANHYHLLVQTDRLKELRAELGNSMAVLRSSGMEKIITVDVKFGTIALTVASGHIAISGPA